MEISLIVRILGFALVPLTFYGIVSLAMRENDKEEVFNLQRERITVRPPKIMGWVASIGMLFFTVLILIIIIDPKKEDGYLFTLLGFFLFDLLGGWLLWITLIW